MKRIGQAPPLCSWLDSKGWTGGAKVQLKINVVEVEVLQTISLKRPLSFSSSNKSLFPGDIVVEYFFRLQQGRHLWSLERGHKCFDGVCQVKHRSRESICVLCRSIYHVTNKCYNGRLYPCQCLEFGYLIRWQYLLMIVFVSKFEIWDIFWKWRSIGENLQVLRRLPYRQHQFQRGGSACLPKWTNV